MRQCPLVAVAGNLQICMVESLAIVNSYSATDEQQDQAAAVLAALEAHKLANLDWIVAGDHNASPDSSTLLDALQSVHAATAIHSGQATRWESNGEIDWIVFNSPNCFTPVWLENTCT